MGCDCEARKRTESLLSSLSFGKRKKYTTFNFPSPKIFHFRSTTATVGWSKSRIFLLKQIQRNTDLWSWIPISF